MPTGNHRLKSSPCLTNEATRVISRLWLIMQLRTKANQLESLVVMSQRLAGEIDDVLMETLARQGRHLMDADGSAFFELGLRAKSCTCIA